MSEKKTAIVWRKSVYDSGKCPICGTPMMDEQRRPVNCTVVQSNKGPVLMCDICALPVAVLREYDGPLEPGELGGHWAGDPI